MAELDIEALKQLGEEWRLVLGEDQVDAIIAALEDRDRLRAGLQKALAKFEEWEEHGVGVKDGIAILRFILLRDVAQSGAALERSDG